MTRRAKIILGGLAGAGALTYLLWPSKASAQPNKPPGPGPSPWKPGHWPTTPFPAIVNSNVDNSLVVRRDRTPNSAASRIGVNNNGTQVQVTQTGLSSTDGSPGEWWAITSPAGAGFSRAVDPTGYVNFTIPGTVTSGVGGYLTPGYAWPTTMRPGFHAAASAASHRARADWQRAVRIGAHPMHVEALRRRYQAAASAGLGKD